MEHKYQQYPSEMGVQRQPSEIGLHKTWGKEIHIVEVCGAALGNRATEKKQGDLVKDEDDV